MSRKKHDPDELFKVALKNGKFKPHTLPSPITREFMEEQEQFNRDILKSVSEIKPEIMEAIGELKKDFAVFTEKFEQMHSWIQEHKISDAEDKKNYVTKPELETALKLMAAQIKLAFYVVFGGVVLEILTGVILVIISKKF